MVVMGEVKAGKSTLINALAAYPVSPTNVLEATAAILEIEHSDEALATIRYRDGQTSTHTVDEVYQLLEKHRGDVDFFRNCQGVRVGMPLAWLRRLRLVDTPGLAAITEENVATTKAYIQQADVVLWVLNALRLGQTDVQEELAEVARLGKPIVAVINRIDQADSAPEPLVRYVQRDLAAYTDEVFALSAAQAFAGVESGDEALQKKSGFSDLLEYLLTEIHVAPDAVKMASALSSVSALLRQDRLIHRTYQQELDDLARLASENRQEMLARGSHIAERVCDRLRERTHQELLMREFHTVEAQAFNPDVVERLISSESVRNWWSKVVAESEAELSEAWRESYHEYRGALNTQLGDLRAQYTQRLVQEDSSDEEHPDPMGLIIEGGGRGAAIGGAAGLGLAAFSALLGPASASISLIGAVSAVVPPLAIAGAAGGAVAALMFRQKKEHQARENSIKLRSHIRDVQQKMIREYLEPRVFPEIRQSCQQYAQQLHREFIDQLCGGWEVEALAQLSERLDSYLAAVEGLLADEGSVLEVRSGGTEVM